MTPSLSRFVTVAVVVAATASASPLSTPIYSSRHEGFAVAPLVAAEHPHGSLNSSYIVMFKEDVAAPLIANHFNFLQQAHVGDSLSGMSGIKHVYDGHIKGYSGQFSDKVVNELRALPEVEFVEKDQIVRTMDIQKGAPWGLARISHRKRLTLGTFRSYEHDPSGGEGVDVYVIDTGINVEHEEFEGRATWGLTVPQPDDDLDGNGHGTHCAGTIASRKYGVAKKANVIAVKVLGSNGSGSMSDVISGVLFASKAASDKATKAEAEFKATGKRTHKGSVANMSLGGGKSPALDRAVNRAVDGGLHFAVAAGNDNRNACNYSPAAAEKAVTVGASTITDERAYFSNHGKCVDVFAPGLGILSTWIGSKRATNTISGTSMASPHTAGLLAYLLSIYPSEQFDPSTKEFYPDMPSQHVFNPISAAWSIARAALPEWISSLLPTPHSAPLPYDTLSTAQLKSALLKLATKDALRDLPTETINLLIFNNATSA